MAIVGSRPTAAGLASGNLRRTLEPWCATLARIWQKGCSLLRGNWNYDNRENRRVNVSRQGIAFAWSKWQLEAVRLETRKDLVTRAGPETWPPE